MRLLKVSQLFLKGSQWSDKRNILPIIFSVLLFLMSHHLYQVHNNIFKISINQDVNNRTFQLTYPMDMDVAHLMDTFKKNPIIINLSYKKEEDFGVYFVQYEVVDYWKHSALKEQFQSYSKDISFVDKYLEVEASLLMKFSKQIHVLLVSVMVISFVMLIMVIVRLLRMKWLEIKIFHVLGYHFMILALFVLLYMITHVGIGVAVGIILFYCLI